MLGDCDLVLTGGTENMSQSPHIIRGIRFGIPFGRDQVVCDRLLTPVCSLLVLQCTVPQIISRHCKGLKIFITTSHFATQNLHFQHFKN